MRSAVPFPCYFDIVKSQRVAGGGIDKQMDVWTEFLPILQDFVPCRGRCPASFWDFATSKKQGKGTADLMMSFGDWFTTKFHPVLLSYHTTNPFVEIKKGTEERRGRGKNSQCSNSDGRSAMTSYLHPERNCICSSFFHCFVRSARNNVTTEISIREETVDGINSHKKKS